MSNADKAQIDALVAKGFTEADAKALSTEERATLLAGETNDSNAPIQGIGMGPQPTAAEVGTDQPGVPEVEKKGGKTVHVTRNLIVNPSDDIKGEDGLPAASYHLSAGVNEHVPAWVADHAFVKAHSGE